MSISTCSAVPLLHDNARWSQQLAVEQVADLIDARDDVIVLRDSAGSVATASWSVGSNGWFDRDR